MLGEQDAEMFSVCTEALLLQRSDICEGSGRSITLCIPVTSRHNHGNMIVQSTIYLPVYTNALKVCRYT